MKKLICIILCIVLYMQGISMAYAEDKSQFYFNDGTAVKLNNTETAGITGKSVDAPFREGEKAVHISGTALSDVNAALGRSYMQTSSFSKRTDKITAEMDYYVESGGGLALRVAQYDKNNSRVVNGTIQLCNVYDEWLQPNRWYRIAVEMDADGVGDTYRVWRNGVLTGEGKFSAKGYGLNFLRIQPVATVQSEYSVYLTNISLYNGSYIPEIPSQLSFPDYSTEENRVLVPEGTESIILSGSAVVNNGVLKGIFEKDAKTLRNGAVKDGDLICTVSDSGIYSYYTIRYDFRDYIVSSETYQVDWSREVISQIPCGTTAKQLLENLYSSDGSLVVTDDSRKVCDSKDLISKGMQVESRKGNRAIYTYKLEPESLIDWDFDTTVPKNSNAVNLRLDYKPDDSYGVVLNINPRDKTKQSGIVENVQLTEDLYLLSFAVNSDDNTTTYVMLNDLELLQITPGYPLSLCQTDTEYIARCGKWANYSLLIDNNNGIVKVFVNGENQGDAPISDLKNKTQLKLLFSDAGDETYLDNVRFSPVMDENCLSELTKYSQKMTQRDIIVDCSFRNLLDLDFNLTSAKGVSFEEGKLIFSGGYINCNDRSFSDKTYINFRVNRELLGNNRLTVLLRGRGDTTSGAIRFLSVSADKIVYLPDVSEASVTEYNDEKEITFCGVFDTDNNRLEIYRDGELSFETNSLSDLSNGRWKDFSFDTASCRFSLSSDSGSVVLKHLIITSQDLISEASVILEPIFMKNGLVISEPTDGSTAYFTVYSNRNTEVPVQAISARYKEKLLDRLKSEEYISLKSGECKTFEVPLELDMDTESIRAYIWDENLSPLGNASEVAITESSLWKRRERSGAVHPYIAVEHGRFDALRNTDAPLEKYWIKMAVSEADNVLSADYTNPESESYIGVETSAGIRCEAGSSMLSQIQSLAFAWQLTGQEKYAGRVWELLEHTAAPYNGEESIFPDWNPAHFLDTSAMAYAYAIAYDWCYDYFSDEELIKIENSIMKYAIEPYLKVCNSAEWSKAVHNRNLVNHGGIFMAAAAIADSHSELYQVLSIAVDGMAYGVSGFNPDGAWLEGGAYWSYSMQYLIPALQTMLTFFGTDFGLLKCEGLRKTGDFAIANQGASGSNNNYHDGGTMRWLNSSPYLFWLADRFDIPYLSNMKLAVMKNGKVSTKIWDIIWYNPEKRSDEVLPLNNYFEGTELVTMQSSWNESSASFASFHGGFTDGSHTHVDGGTFVFDYNGVRWACDLPNESYDAEGYGSGLDSKNTYYRVRAEGHNTLVIAPDETAGQDLDGFTTVSEYDFDSDSPFATLDMTDAYKSKASEVKRTIQLTDNKTSLMVKDYICLNKNSDVYWFMHTQADAKVQSDGTVLLSKDGKSMILEFICNRDAKISIEKAEPLSTSPEPYGGSQSDNSAYRKVQIKVAGAGETSLTVKIKPNGI